MEPVAWTGGGAGNDFEIEPGPEHAVEIMIFETTAGTERSVS